jgi:hypothetical protein
MTMPESLVPGEDQRFKVEKYFGKYPGKVVEPTSSFSPNDPHSGELWVEVPGILEETPDGNGQQPIRVLAKPCLPPWFFFIPEKDTQVWVEFAAGDINSPIWSGVWYPPKATPRDVGGNAPTKAKKIIRIPAGNGEHVVQFDDNGITIKDCNGNQLVMDKDGVKITNGKGNPELVVLEPFWAWLNDWLQKHEHTGNMGSPTQLFPISQLELDSMSPDVSFSTSAKPTEDK